MSGKLLSALTYHTAIPKDGRDVYVTNEFLV